MTSMYRAYALTMTRPQEKLGIPQSVSRELALHAPAAWTAFLGIVAVAVVLTYIATIAMSSTRGFQLRDAQNRVDRLQSEARQLETDVAKASSVGSLAARASGLGFVAVDRVNIVNAAGNSYALAR
jgi:hypothetical protein